MPLVTSVRRNSGRTRRAVAPPAEFARRLLGVQLARAYAGAGHASRAASAETEEREHSENNHDETDDVDDAIH